MHISELQKEAYETAVSKGWHETERSPLEYHMLIVSEVAEATEAVREGSPPIYQIYVPNQERDEQYIREVEFNDMIFLVDDRDYSPLKEYKWYPSFDGNSYYLKSNVYPEGTTISYHNKVVNPPDGMMVDHIDGDTLNNLRHNLRVCRPSQNQANQKKQKRDTTSKYKGVYFNTSSNKWKAQIGHGGKRLSLGSFLTEEDAAKCYDIAALEIFGKFARTNFSNLKISEIEITPKDFRWDCSSKCEGEAIELADAVIRIADYFGSRGWDLEEAIKIKLSFNKTRSWRHGGKKI